MHRSYESLTDIVVSFLDLPDLAQLSTISLLFRKLASDPALHRLRVLVVAPSRIRHFLFARDGNMRPTVGDLVRRGVMRGLGIERRWRNGLYFYSPQVTTTFRYHEFTPTCTILDSQSVKQYWTCHNLERAHARHLISSLLDSRPSDPSKVHHTARVVLPDVDSCSPHISRMLLPVVRQLKWSLQRDRLAKKYREKAMNSADWFESNAQSLYPEGERVRLAICPGVRRFVRFYEGLAM